MKLDSRITQLSSLLPFIIIALLLLYVELLSYPFKSLVSQLINAIFGLSIISIIMFISARVSYIAKIIFALVFSIYLAIIVYFAKFYGGFIDIGSFASIVESNITESKEYLYQLDGDSFLLAFFVCLVVFSATMFLAKKGKQNKYNIYIYGLILVIITFVKIINVYESKHSIKEWVTAAFSHHFSFDTALLAKDYLEHASIMGQKISPSWNNVSYVYEENNNYVVVLGESADRKHMALYGYDRNTTPLLEELQGLTLFTDAISPAAQTRNSVPRMLMINNKGGVDYNKNIVDLAKGAGFETYWISNQGFIGRHDTPVTKIASRADHVIFLNNSDFSRSSFDSHLLAPIIKSLKNKAEKKVIFIHLLGSHPEFCSRVWEPYFMGSPDMHEEINCYDDSIKNTMSLLSDIMDELKKYGGKLIYTADHGVVEVDAPPYLVHGVGKRFSINALQVPLFVWDSDKQSNVVVNKTYYMRNFINTLAEYLSIKSDDINYKYSILSNEYTPSTEEDYVIRSSGEVYYFK